MNKSLECYGIAYDSHNELCIKCSIANTCKRTTIQNNKMKKQYMDVI